MSMSCRPFPLPGPFPFAPLFFVWRFISFPWQWALLGDDYALGDDHALRDHNPFRDHYPVEDRDALGDDDAFGHDDPVAARVHAFGDDDAAAGDDANRDARGRRE